MLIPGFRHFLSVFFSILCGLFIAYESWALDCYSDSPSVEAGQSIYESISPRDLVEGEHDDLEELLRGLAGRWSGSVEVESCREIDDEVITEVEEFTVQSKIEWRRSGEFSVKSQLKSEQNRSTHQDRLYLCLSRQRLATVCSLAASNIELLSAASDGLEYVQKFANRPNRLNGEAGSDNVREIITAIRKDSPTFFTLEKLVYYQGRLYAKETWRLELK